MMPSSHIDPCNGGQHANVRMQALLDAAGRSCSIAAIALLPTAAMASDIDVFHADSLSGPMREIKLAFEARNAGVNLRLTSGVSRDLAARILKGDVCDVFAPSSPAVIDEDLMHKKIAGSGQDAATWYVVFSANEMVVIVAKGNPLGIREVSDLLRPQVRFVRVNGEKDLATGRTIEFVKRATAKEGKPELATEDHRQRDARPCEGDDGARGRRGRPRRQGECRGRLLLRGGGREE